MTLPNRRNLLVLGAATVGGMGMGGTSTCSTAAATILPAVIDDIQAAVAAVCGFVPDVATLLTLLSVFPGIGGVATVAGPIVTEVSNFLCTAFMQQGGAPAAVAAAAAKTTLSMKLAAGSTPIHGLIAVPNGKMVKF
jgi:hypothetical protein